MMSYCGKLTGDHLSRYLNKTELVGLRKAYCLRQIGDLIVTDAKYLNFLALMHNSSSSEQNRLVKVRLSLHVAYSASEMS